MTASAGTPDYEPVADRERNGSNVGLVSWAPDEQDVQLRIEDQCRLSAAERQWPGGYWITCDGRRAYHSETGFPLSVERILESGAALYGRLPNSLPRAQWPEADLLANRYGELEAFRRNAGRQVVLAGYGDADRSLVSATEDLLGDGPVRIKVVQPPKYGHWRIAPTSAVEKALWETLGLALEHLSDRHEAFLVQAEATMRYEYRLFVVQHQVVTGAGCIDRYTPLENAGHAFDPNVELVRGDGDILHCPHLVRVLVDFGCEVAQQVAHERPAMSEYVLDVAMVNGLPGVVELNGLRNSGLYASQPHRVVSALAHSRSYEPVVADA